MLKQLFCSSLLFVSFLSFSENLNIENQYNTLDNMFSGYFSTQLTVNEAMKKNNNFGLGLAKELGELIVIDNKYYVADSKGNAKLMKGNDGISYLTATDFDSDNAFHFEIKKPMTLIKIQNLINEEYNLADTLYAAKVIGKFEYITASNQNRVLNQILLKKWAKNHQHDFTVTNTKATIVSFYTPLSKNEFKGISIQPRYTHFISSDMRMGNVLNAKILSGDIYIQKIDKVNIIYPKNENTNNNVDLKDAKQIKSSPN